MLDAALHRVILFGGQDNNVYFSDTWELVPAPTPTPTPTPNPQPPQLHLHQRPLHQLLPRPEPLPGLVPRHVLARRRHDSAFVGLLTNKRAD